MQLSRCASLWLGRLHALLLVSAFVAPCEVQGQGKFVGLPLFCQAHASAFTCSAISTAFLVSPRCAQVDGHLAAPPHYLAAFIAAQP